mgnify:CR=1 FL=1
MVRSRELDALKAREQAAFHCKQANFQKYSDAKNRTSSAYETMQAAWIERCSTRETMNREYEILQSFGENYRKVWDDYGAVRSRNSARIESLRYEADSEHQQMKDCFDRASDAYNYGNKAEAPMLSADGRMHKERRDSLNLEVSALIQETRDAKERAQSLAPKTDSSTFHRAKEAFNAAKARHESAQAEFKRLKAERDRCKAEFDAAQAEHIRLKEEFQKWLEKLKSDNQRERDKILDKAGVGWFERDTAKIVKKSDGTVQIYYGGLGKGDGYGHGHAALDQYGNKIYDRGAFEEHDSHNYTDNGDGTWSFDLGGKTAKGYPNRKDPEHFTDILYGGTRGNVKGDKHGHIIIENSTGDVVFHREAGEDSATTWDQERCP